jgi:hypothetical protein
MTGSMAAIEIVREEMGHITHGRYRVLIDGEEVGTLGNGETGHYEVEPGRHDVAVASSRWGSKTLSISLPVQETVRVRCWLIGFLGRIRAGTYETDRWISLETLEQPDGAEIQVSAGPTVAGRKDRHRTLAVAIGVLGVLMLADSLLLLHFGEVPRGILGVSEGAATLPFAYLGWLPRSPRVDALKTTWLGICVTVFSTVFLLTALVRRHPLDSITVFVIGLVLGICALAIGIIRLFASRDS